MDGGQDECWGRKGLTNGRNTQGLYTRRLAGGSFVLASTYGMGNVLLGGCTENSPLMHTCFVHRPTHIRSLLRSLALDPPREML